MPKNIDDIVKKATELHAWDARMQRLVAQNASFIRHGN
jgi:hypothetical protein